MWDDLDIEKICDIRIDDNHVTQQVLKILTESFNTYCEYLNNSINDILDDSSARASMASNGRELVLSKYTYEQNANDFIEIYQSIIN